MTDREVRGHGISFCLSCLGVFMESETVAKAASEGQGEVFLVALAGLIAEAEKEVFVDPLSGLRNRKFFDRQLLVEATRAVEGIPLAALLLDLDGFKGANDKYGHLAGDRVLADFASILRREVRRGDFPARVGGDEFGVILPGASREGVLALAQRVIAGVKAHRFKSHEDEAVAGIGVSGGYAVYPDDTGSHQRRADAARLASTLFDLADRALYAAKSGGKARVVGYSETKEAREEKKETADA